MERCRLNTKRLLILLRREEINRPLTIIEKGRCKPKHTVRLTMTNQLLRMANYLEYKKADRFLASSKD